jgi:pimeloyl-ACP methyl ester carboxylesterase
LTYIRLLSLGFTFYRPAFSRFLQLFPFRFQALLATNQSPAENLTYWYRPHTSNTKLPILFIHGIGIGLYPYVNLLKDLNSTHGLESADPNDQVGIIALEIMPVAFRITNAALSKTEMCTQIKQILDHHGWSKIVLVSHSYGTVVSTHLLKTPSTAQLIGPIVLIDPVSILLHLPDVAYNFTRRKPERANEHQLYYFASMDCSVSNTLSRHFFWSETMT